MADHATKQRLRNVGQLGQRNRSQSDDDAARHEQQPARPALSGNAGPQTQMCNLATVNHGCRFA